MNQKYEKNLIPIFNDKEESDIMKIRGSFFNGIASRIIRRIIFKKTGAKGLISVKDLEIDLDKNGCSFLIQIEGNFDNKNTNKVKENLLNNLL